MAKKSSANGKTDKPAEKVTKSQAIRDALAKSSDGSPKQVVADLAAQGIKVSPAFVSIIKGKMNAKGRKRGKSRGVATQNGAAKQNGAPKHSVDSVVMSDLVEAKRLVDKVGGIENAESLLGTLKRLR